MTNESIVQLDPARILADDNSRFGIKPTATETLMQSILEHDGVMEPVEVSELPADSPARKQKFTHRLTFGFGRHAAVSKLNAEQGAGLTLPAIVREAEDETGRMKRQIAENNDRESLSPMDKAVAISRLKAASVDVKEIRRIFSSAGGRKGNTVQPMSNAMLNIHLRMLELPKAIQEKIHDGRVGVAGAYALGRVNADKRADVLKRAEEDREAEIAAEEKEEEKYLNAEKRVADAHARAAEAEKAVEVTKAEVETAKELVKVKIEAMKAVKVGIAQQEDPAGPKDVEAIKAAEADVKGAQKVYKDATAKLAKAIDANKTADEKAEEAKAKLEASRKAQKKGTKGKKTIGKTDVERAAKKLGAESGVVPLTIGDIRQTIKDLVNGKNGADDRTVAVAGLFKSCFDGHATDKELALGLNKLLDTMGAKLPVKAPVAPKMPPAPAVKQGPKK